MEFNAGDAVTEINETRAGVLFDYLLALLERFEDDDARILALRLVCARGKIKVMTRAVFGPVKALRPGGEHFFDVGRDGAAFLTQLRNRFLNADGIPDLERPHLVREAPLHRIVNFDDVVGDFRNAVGGVDQ